MRSGRGGQSSDVEQHDPVRLRPDRQAGEGSASVPAHVRRDDDVARAAVAAMGGRLSAESMLTLQRAIGNAAVARLVDGQRRAAGSTATEVLGSAGRPLGPGVRERMETRLGADFSEVRLHDDAASHRSAEEMGARAYTSGSHVVIGRGGGDEHTLAHELVHVVQQRRGPVSGTDRGNGLRVSDPGDRFEREAESVAREVMARPVPDRTRESPGRPTDPGHGHAGHDHPSVQRTVHPSDTPAGRDTDKGVFTDLADFAVLLDNAVARGWAQATQDPTNAQWAKVDGYLARWALQWETFSDPDSTRGERESIAPMVPAMCGYAIESLATKVFLAENKAWTGKTSGRAFTVVMQETNGNTRPDVVLKDGSKSLAWYDITSEKSRGHIFEKDGAGWKTMPYVAEITYPAVTAETVAANSKKWIDSGRPVIFNDPLLFARTWMERARFEITMAQMQRELAAGGDTSPIMAARSGADEAGVSEARRRNYLRALLGLFRGGALAAAPSAEDVKLAVKKEMEEGRFTALAPEPKETAAVLTYLTGRDRSAFGFRTGDGKSMYPKFSLQPGVVWLQECAGSQNRVVSDVDAVAYVQLTWPDAVGALKAAGLVK